VNRLQGSVGSLAISLALIVAALTLVMPAFGGAANIDSVAFGWANLGVVALAQMVVLGSGGMSLAVGAIAGIAVVTAGGLMDSFGAPAVVAVPVALGCAALCGLLNGLLINRTRLSAFIVTLATASIFTGVILGLTAGRPYYRLPREFLWLGSGAIVGIPVPAVIAFASATALWALFRFVGLGRQALAIGGNRRAAELLGVPILRVELSVHALSGMLAGVAGLVLSARIGAAQPTIGNEWLLASFAAPIIGGTALAGGLVSVPGAMLGALLLAVVANALTFLGVTSYWAMLPAGAIILVAAAIDRVRDIRDTRSERLSRRDRLLRAANPAEQT